MKDEYDSRKGKNFRYNFRVFKMIQSFRVFYYQLVVVGVVLSV